MVVAGPRWFALSVVLVVIAAGCGRIGFDVTGEPGSAGGDGAGGDGVSGVYPEVVLSDSPIAYWRLGEATGTIAIDSAGSNDGMYFNQPTLGVTGALSSDPDTAVFLSQTTDYVDVPDTPALRLNGSWSIELWMQMTALAAGSFPTPISKGSSIDSGWVIYYKQIGGPMYRPVLKRASIDNLETSAAIPMSGYRYYVLTYDGAVLRWYVDGVADMQYTVALPPCNDATELRFGRDTAGISPTNNTDVSFDEVALYANALAPARIAAHYAAARP
jgi:hypothetical protein